MKINIFLFLVGLVIIYCIFIKFMLTNIEGYQSTYSNEYLKTVDLPITFPFSCKNFCGPGNTCAITGEQCTNDYDCTGCENIPKYKPPKVEPHYKELSQNNEQMDYVYVGSKNNLTPLYYSGGNDWIKSFNKGIELYNRKELFNNPLDEFEKKIVSVYPKTTSATGQYYETTASAYNKNI
jgi:hypothetical protein